MKGLKMFFVDQYTFNTENGTTSYKSRKSFETLEEATKFYNSNDIKHDWLVELSCQPSVICMERYEFVKELYADEEMTINGITYYYGDSILFDTYGYENWRGEN